MGPLINPRRKQRQQHHASATSLNRMQVHYWHRTGLFKVLLHHSQPSSLSRTLFPSHDAAALLLERYTQTDCTFPSRLTTWRAVSIRDIAFKNCKMWRKVNWKFLFSYWPFPAVSDRRIQGSSSSNFPRNYDVEALFRESVIVDRVNSLTAM